MNETNGRKRTQWKQWAAGITATLTMVCVGTVYGWTTTNLNRLLNANSPIVMNSIQRSWIVSLTDVGTMTGPFIGAASADTIGRKKTLLVTSLFYGFGWLINIFATRVEEMYAARVILGIGIGISYTTNPMYISEIADVNIRGALGTLIIVNIFSGSVFACIVGPILSVEGLSAVLFVVPVIFFCLFVWFPETPYYLVSKGNYFAATESLIFFKGISNHQEAEEELEAVILSVKKNSDDQTWLKKLRHMFLPNNRKALGIILTLIIGQSMSGNYSTMAYLKVLFKTAKIGIDPNLATVIVLAVGLFSCAIATVTIERVGRRFLLMVSTLGSCITLAILATYLVANERGVDMKYCNWVPVVTVILFQIIYHIGLGAIPDALIGELFPTNVMSIGSAAVIISSGVSGVVISQFYQRIGDAVGPHVVYYIFSAACFCTFLFSVAFLPETMNKKFDEIQEELADSRLQCFKRRSDP